MNTSNNDTNQTPSTVKSEITSLVLVVIFALTIRTFVLELFYVPTGSMNGTIVEGDYIFSTKYDYGYSIYSIPFNPDLFKGRILAKQPQRGDVVIMRPPHLMEERYIKRLIGLPKDKIEIIKDVTYINDVAVKRVEVGEYTNIAGQELIKFKETLPNGMSFFSYKMKYPDNDIRIDQSNYGPYIVEDDHYFFLGDNRDNSGDSRYQLGTVPFENLIAKGRFVVFSAEEKLWKSSLSWTEQIKQIGTWILSIRFNRLFDNLYDTEIQDSK